MSNPNHLMRAAFDAPNLLRKSIGRRAYLGLLIATTGATVLSGGSAAHSGPCTLQIAQLERQIAQAGSSPETGPTAAQSVGGLLHHQPTPILCKTPRAKQIRMLPRRSTKRVWPISQVARSPALKALDEAKHHWVIPPLS